MKRVVLCSLVLLVLMGISSANATLIPPFPAGGPAVGTPIGGESQLVSVFDPTSFVSIDWWVINLGGGIFEYQYQLENGTATSLSSFTIGIGNADAAIVASGHYAGDDLDIVTAFHPAHVLGGEIAEEVGGIVDPIGHVVNIGFGSINWTFGAPTPLAPGKESATLYYRVALPPTYGPANALDGPNPSPWVSPDPVPVPTPEPGSVTAIAGIVLLGLVGYVWRRRK